MSGDASLARSARFMQMAIDHARAGIAAGQTPFGACIVRGDEVISVAHNGVFQTTDITAHAEIQAIRLACASLGVIDLSGCEIFSTTEPCPMCFSAIHWARIGRIVYGAAIEDAARAGFNELTVSNETLKREGRLGVEIMGGFMREECVALFREWGARTGRRSY